MYDDVINMAGPSNHLETDWTLIRDTINTDEPHDVGLFLGCNHRSFEKLLPDSGIKVRGIEHDMEDFLRSCVERYKVLTGATTLRRASTPFLTEPTKPDFSSAADDPVSDK